MNEFAGAKTSLNNMIGAIVWGCRRAPTGFLTMEFGQPHLEIREPIDEVKSKSTKVRELLLRRRVWIKGDWHLWLEECCWEVNVVNGKCDKSSDDAVIDSVLEMLDGQILTAVESNISQEKQSHNFMFDMGGLVKVCWGHRRDGDGEGLSLWEKKSATLFQTNGKILTQNLSE